MHKRVGEITRKVSMVAAVGVGVLLLRQINPLEGTDAEAKAPVYPPSQQDIDQSFLHATEADGFDFDIDKVDFDNSTAEIDRGICSVPVTFTNVTYDNGITIDVKDYTIDLFDNGASTIVQTEHELSTFELRGDITGLGTCLLRVIP